MVHPAQLFPPYFPPPTLWEKKKERDGATKREIERSTKKALAGFILCFLLLSLCVTFPLRFFFPTWHVLLPAYPI